MLSNVSKYFTFSVFFVLCRFDKISPHYELTNYKDIYTKILKTRYTIVKTT